MIELIRIARAIGFDPGDFINTFMDEPADLDAARRCSPALQPAASRIVHQGPDLTPTPCPGPPVPTLTAEAPPPRAPRSSRPEGIE